MTARAPPTGEVMEGGGDLKVTIKGWHGVAFWNWNVQGEETCGICRNHYEMCCPDCKKPGDDCPPTWGRCKHAFHLHCIMQWIRGQEAGGGSRSQCPICRAEWEFLSEAPEVKPEVAAAGGGAAR